VESATRIVAAKVCGAEVRGKLTVRFTKPQRAAAAEEALERCAALAESFMVEAADAASVVRSADSLTARVRSALPEGLPVRALDIEAMHVLGDVGTTSRRLRASSTSWQRFGMTASFAKEAARPSPGSSSPPDVRSTSRPPPEHSVEAARFRVPPMPRITGGSEPPPRRPPSEPPRVGASAARPAEAEPPRPRTGLRPRELDERRAAPPETTFETRRRTEPQRFGAEARLAPMPAGPEAETRRRAEPAPLGGEHHIPPAPQGHEATPRAATDEGRARPAPRDEVAPRLGATARLDERPPATQTLRSAEALDEVTPSARQRAAPVIEVAPSPTPPAARVGGGAGATEDAVAPREPAGAGLLAVSQTVPSASSPLLAAAAAAATPAKAPAAHEPSPHSAGAALAPLVRDAAQKILFACLRAHELVHQRRMSGERAASRLCAWLATVAEVPTGGCAEHLHDEVEGFRRRVGADEVRAVEREAMLAATCLAYFMMLDAGVSRAVAIGVLETLSVEAFPGQHLTASLGRYLYTLEPALDAELAMSVTDILAPAGNPDPIADALDPLLAEIADDLALAARHIHHLIR
jgi:hypothetical protein